MDGNGGVGGGRRWDEGGLGGDGMRQGWWEEDFGWE